jgi:hypothetical protein
MRLFVLIIILSGIVGVLFFLNPGMFSKPNPAVISESIQDFIPKEKPIPVKWQGEIFAVIESGNGFAIKKVPEDKENPYVLANFRDPERREGIGGKVLVTGTWEGMDCSAYQRTVFYGHCAQYVLIDQIENLR